LDDQYNMVDESTIEPDYFVDIAPQPIFVPD
jgi:hypothetical protein